MGGGLKREGVSSSEKEGDIREGANKGFTVINAFLLNI